MNRMAAACIGLPFLALTVTGCAGATEPSSGWQVPAIEELPPFTAASTLPFDAYRLSDDRLEELQRTHAALLTDCARDYGVQVTFSGDYVRPADNPRLIWGGRIGTLDETHASVFGYHPAPEGEWAPVGGFYLRDPANLQPDPVPDDPAADERNRMVIFGPDSSGSEEQDITVPTDPAGQPVPDGGCWNLVEAELDTPLASELDVDVELYNLTLLDGRVEDAIAEWSDCMSAAGYEFDEVQSPSRSFTLAELTPEETQVALADVHCTAESRWADTFYAVLADYQRQAIEKDPSLFDAVLASQKARLAAQNEHAR